MGAIALPRGLMVSLSNREAGHVNARFSPFSERNTARRVMILAPVQVFAGPWLAPGYD